MSVGWAGRDAPPLAPLAARPRPAPIAGNWTFWADQIIPAANQLQPPAQIIPLGPVQCTHFSCDWVLSGFGSGECTILVDTSAVGAEDLLRLWSWRLWALYQGDPVWCGFVTGIADEGRAAVQCTLTEVTGFLKKRQFGYRHRWDQTEQTEIARHLADPVQEVGVAIMTEPGPGMVRDRAYEFLESESRAQLLTNLAEVIDGPEFRTEYFTGTDAMPHARLRISYPRVGNTGTDLGITVPGGAMSYSLRWDSDELRTRTYAVGDVPESAPEGTRAPFRMTDRPQARIPRLDAVDSWPGVILESTLGERANTAATQYASPVLDVSATMHEAGMTPATAIPRLGSYRVGDSVHLRITSPLLPGGLDGEGRLTGLHCNAADHTVSWDVTTRLPPPKPRQTLVQRLNALQYLSDGMFRARIGNPPSQE